MLEIGKTVVSFDLLDKYFVCDLLTCKGACCLHGDSGAPLEDEEVELLPQLLEKIKPFMQAAGIEAIEQQGASVIDIDGDKVTPLINGKECAYAFFENGVVKCAIEKAYIKNKIEFRKPISCYLYPVRVTKYATFEAVNYHKWEICNCALDLGNTLKEPIYVFLKEPLIKKYGKGWYEELSIAADHFLEKSK